MRRVGYPNLNKHRLGHAVFVRELMNLVTEVQSGTILDCACLGEYAATWMRTHVLTGDMDIRRFLIQGR
jgi:hemerythrin